MNGQEFVEEFVVAQGSEVKSEGFEVARSMVSEVCTSEFVLVCVLVMLGIVVTVMAVLVPALSTYHGTLVVMALLGVAMQKVYAVVVWAVAALSLLSPMVAVVA